MHYEKSNRTTTSIGKKPSTVSHSQPRERLMEETFYQPDYEGPNDNDASENDQDDQQPELYIVEKIIKKRVYQGKVQYFVKWLDYPSKSNTWEPLANLYTIPNMIYQFEYGLPQTGIVVAENDEEEGEEGEEGGENGDDVEKYQPQPEDVDRILGHDTIDGKVKYLVSYKCADDQEVQWVSRSELPKKKLNEYNEYLKNGGLYNFNNNNPLFTSQTTNKNTTSTPIATAAAVVTPTTTATTAMEEEDEQQQKPQQQEEQVVQERVKGQEQIQQEEDKEMDVKLEDNSNEIDTIKDKDANSTPSKPSIPTIWQSNSNSKSQTKSIMKQSSSRLDDKSMLSPGLSQLDKILDPIQPRKAILKKNKPSQRKSVTFSEVEEDLCKDNRKSQATKRQTPLKRIGSTIKEVKSFKDLITSSSSPAVTDINKTSNNNDKQQISVPSAEQSSISTPSVNSTNAFKAMSSIRATAIKKETKNGVANDKNKEIDKKDSQDSKNLQNSMKASNITAVGQPVKQLTQKEEILTASKGKGEQSKQAIMQTKDTKEAVTAALAANQQLPSQRLQIQSPLAGTAAASAASTSPFDQSTAVQQLQSSQSQQLPPIVTKPEKIINYQQSSQATMIQYQQAQYMQHHHAQQVYSQQQQLPQPMIEVKKEKVIEMEGSFEQGDCEHKVTIRSLERELEDMIFEVFWKPRADGNCPRSKLVKYSDLKKHAPYKLIYWLEVMVRNSVQELESNEFRYNQLVSQQQQQQQQQQQYHSHIHGGF